MDLNLEIDVTQVISILPENAPKVIASVGTEKSKHSNTRLGIAKYPSIKNLIVKVLQPIVTNEFLNAAKEFDALDFHEKRSEIQLSVTISVRDKLREGGIEAEETLINEIHLPLDLQTILQNRALRDERSRDIESDIEFQEQLKLLAHAEALTQLQEQLAESEQGVTIAELQAKAEREKGTAQADILHAMINVLGRDGYLTQQQIQNLGNLTLPQNLFIGGGSGGSAVDVLQSLMFPSLLQQDNPITHTLMAQGQSDSQLPAPPPSQSLPSAALRCPIILLIDTSEAMSNESLSQMVEGLSILKQQVISDIRATKQVDISVVTVGGGANLAQSFIPIEQFSVPRLQSTGSNNLYQGLEIALKAVEAQKVTYQGQGLSCYKPWMILLTRSTPPKQAESITRRIAQQVNNTDLLLLTIGIEDSNLQELSQIVSTGFPPVMLDESKSHKFYQWLASALKGLCNRAVGEEFSLPPRDTWEKRS